VSPSGEVWLLRHEVTGEGFVQTVTEGLFDLLQDHVPDVIQGPGRLGMGQAQGPDQAVIASQDGEDIFIVGQETRAGESTRTTDVRDHFDRQARDPVFPLQVRLDVEPGGGQGREIVSIHVELLVLAVGEGNSLAVM